MLDEMLEVLRGHWTPKLVVVTDEKTVRSDGAYEAEDVVSESTTIALPWYFANMARKPGGSGHIICSLITAETTNIAAWLTLYLYTAIPICELNDDVQNTGPRVEDRHKYVGRIDHPACSDLGTSMSETMATPSTVGNLPMPFVCAPTISGLYGVMVIRNAVDLADRTLLTVRLTVEQY